MSAESVTGEVWMDRADDRGLSLCQEYQECCLARNILVPVQDYTGIKPGSSKNVLLNLFFLLQLSGL